MSYTIGDQSRLSAAFATAAGAAVDPTVVTLKIKAPPPTSTVTTHVYGTDANVIKDSTGNYHYDVTLSQSGTYRYRWEGTGAAICADEGSLNVNRSKF
jgi:hypothetical protein